MATAELPQRQEVTENSSCSHSGYCFPGKLWPWLPWHHVTGLTIMGCRLEFCFLLCLQVGSESWRVTAQAPTQLSSSDLTVLSLPPLLL